MKKDNIDFLGLTPLEEISKSDYYNHLLIQDTDLFFTKRKSPSIKYITKMIIDFYTTNNSIIKFKKNKILSFDGIKKYTLEFIDNDNKHSTLTREYPLCISASIPINVSNYKLFLIDANIYPLEKRVVKANLQFILCYSLDTSMELTSSKSSTDKIEVSEKDTKDLLTANKEILDIDEEFM